MGLCYHEITSLLKSYLVKRRPSYKFPVTFQNNLQWSLDTFLPMSCCVIESGSKEEDIEVDITTVEPIQAFLSSDEEDEDSKALLFLPVSPEIEESEEGWPGEGVSYFCSPFKKHFLKKLIRASKPFTIKTGTLNTFLTV